eukprot:gene18821-22488_t
MCPRNNSCGGNSDYCCEAVETCSPSHRPCYPGCTDLADGSIADLWVDSAAETCEDYFVYQYCNATGSGAYGTGWKGGTFEDYAVNGVSVPDALSGPPPPVPRISELLVWLNAALLNGGALYSRSTNIVLAENMTVSGNTAQESGGAFYLEKDTILRLVGSLVSNNRALDGGAIWTQGIWNATNGVRVVGNLADRDGGAVYGAPSAVLTVSASLVQANAASVGGGLYVEFASKMTLTDGSVLEHNTATHKGGGMFCGESSIVMVDGCSVSHNLVWLNDVGAGGGIYLEVGANASVAHCLLSNNSVSSVHTSEGGTTGGAVFMAESSTLTLDSTDLEMNSATEGGGVYASSNTTLGMRGSKAAMNMASYGGGISAQLDARVVLSDGSILVSNIAEHTGGGVMVQHLSVYDSQILNNSANTEGGGVYAQSFIEMVNATVSGNSASTAGGISFVSAWHAETEQSLQLTGCLVYGNRGLNGGGLHAEGQRNAVLMLRLDEGTIFSSNIAEETGGGLMMHKYTSLTMDNASLSNNTAVFGGCTPHHAPNLAVFDYGECVRFAVYVNASVAVIDDVTYASPQFDWAVQNPDVTSIHLRVHVALSAPLQELRNRSLSVYGECMDDAGGASRCLISGEETYSIFAAGEGSALYLEALELRDGYTLTFGAALRLSLANATLADCVLAANKAVGTEIKGGGVWAENSHLLCTSCRFEGNEAYLGAAIFATWSSTVVLDNTVLEGNAAGHSGGAIVIENGTSLTIGGASRVIGNTAKSYGGGLCVMENSRFELDGTSEISDNEATSGGGCTADSGSNITLRGLVSRNYAKDTGGALYTRFIGPNICLLDGCRIVNNTAKQLGGGIMLNAVESLVFFGNGSAITGNAALLNGGALYSRSTNIVLAENMTVSGNTAQESGGAFYLEKDTILRLVGSLVSNNRALDGGAIWTQGIWNATNGVRVLNFAANSGGGVYMASLAVLVVSEGSCIQDNSVGMVGGGVYGASASQILIARQVRVQQNRAAREGGGIFLQSGLSMDSLTWLRVEDATVADNRATYYSGGGISSDTYCAVELVRMNLTGNQAGYTGGGYIAINSAVHVLDHTIIAWNTANHGGGIAMTASLSEEERAWADAAVLRITHTVFLENEGTTTAGALLVLGVAQVFLGVAAAAGGNASSPKPSNLLAPPAWSCRHSVCLERNFKGVMVFEGSTGNVLHDVLLTYNHDGHTGGGIEDGATVDVEGLSQVAIAMVHISLGSQVELRGCSFDGNVGSAVSVTDKSSTNLTHVAVENHTAMVGAGLTVDPDSSATVENSSFVKCRVLHGGAIYASGSLFVSGSLFKDNTALDGGALHLNLAHYGTQSVHHCKFIGNAAFGNGGVMMLEAHTDGEVNNISLQALQFSGNSARLGGAVGFWQPQDLSADPFPPPCDDCEPQNGTNMAAYGSPEGWATSALHLLSRIDEDPSFNPLTVISVFGIFGVDAVQAQESSLQLVQHAITVRIADAFNATVTVDNTSVVELNLDTPACGLEGKNRVTVVAGIATFLGEATGIAFKGSPGISCQVFFTSDFTGINATEVTSNPTLVPLRYCTAGEQLLRSSAWTYCSACPEGSISLGNESQCTECAKYLDCELEEGECPITCPGGAAFVVCQGGYVAPEAQYCADDNECLLDRASTCPKEQACTTSEDAETCSRDDKNNAGRIGQGAATVGSLELCDRVAYAGPGSVMCGGKLPVSCSE